MINYIRSSIGKKQIVATTGLFLILFVVAHLLGNLLIFMGPDVFNAYGKKIEHLRPGFYVVEAALLLTFLTHMFFTALLVLQNREARNKNYCMTKPKGRRSVATQLMPYTGTIVLVFVIWHLLDFTFTDKHGPDSVLPDGHEYGLYGVVYNAFADPIHSCFYILAMIAVGLHLSHGIQSFIQTFGFSHQLVGSKIQIIGKYFALVVTVAFIAIPVYVMFHYYTF